MDCAEAKLRIEPYLAGRLMAEERLPLEQHLASCAECRLDSELTRAAGETPALAETPAPVETSASGEPPAASATSSGSVTSAPGGTSTPPDGPEAAPSSRSAPPGGAESNLGSAPSQDWNLERIFGAGTSTPAGAPTPARGESPSARTESRSPRVEPPARAEERSPAPRPIPSAAAPPPEDEEGSMGDHSVDEPSSWEFEPADSKTNVKPPAGSLFFAEEALSRGTPPRKRKKHSLLRGLLWLVGGAIGIVLLAFSAWIAFTLKQPNGSSLIAGSEIPDSTAASDSLGSGNEMPASGEAADPGSLGSPETAPDASGGIAGSPDPSHASGSTPSLVEAGGLAAGGARLPLDSTKQPAGISRPAAQTPAPPPGGTRPKTTEIASPRENGTHASTAGTATKTSKPAPPASPEPEIPDDEADIPFASRTTSRTPPPPPPSETTAPPPSGASTKPPAVTGGSGEPGAKESADQAPAAEPASDPIQRPIDRVHLATLKAEESADLNALRKLRDTWRGLVKSSVGPERARAKRELADCLWAIQTITGKNSDQKAALVAYREYVLYAPAGGADARTVSRMRQLEDALSEAR